MGWWKADSNPESRSPLPPSPPPPTTSPPPPATPPLESSSSSCPVDHKTRSIWLRQQQGRQEQQQQSTPPKPPTHTPYPRASEPPPPGPPLYTAPHRPQAQPQPFSHPHPQPQSPSLSTTRQISSIPRAFPSSTTSSPNATIPSNTESTHSSSSNWIYPSESQFLSALQRKHSLPPSSPSHATLSSTIPSIIPLHNAVNERAWSLIRAWEGSTSAACGGPRLLSFRGQGTGFAGAGTFGQGQQEEDGDGGRGVPLMKQLGNIVNPYSPLTPRARWKSLIGYQEPFDRHDWVVQRCDGSEVEYVIDFYQGRGGAGPVSFYLDVRPKLNCWEGVRLRVRRFWGWDA